MIDRSGQYTNRSTVNGHVHLSDAIMDAGKFHNGVFGVYDVQNTDNTWRTHNYTKIQNFTKNPGKNFAPPSTLLLSQKN